MLSAPGRNQWIVPALVCSVILAGAVGGGVWWSRRVRPASALEQGQAAYDQGNWPAAERKAREQLRQHGEDTRARRLLARSLHRQGREQAAGEIYARLAPSTMEADDYLLVGQALIHSHNVDRAIEVLQKAVHLDANHFQAWLALEHLYLLLDRLSDAERQAELLLAQSGREALGELFRGQICIQRSDPAGAATALERALVRADQWSFMADPDFVRKQLARCLLRTGRPALARAQLRQLTARDRDPETCWLLSRCDLQEAIPTDMATLAQARSYRESNPIEPEPAPFVGGARCAQCHERIVRDQHQSRHALTLVRREQLAGIPSPQRPIPDPNNASVLHAFRKHRDLVEVQTLVDGQVYQTLVDYAFGSGYRGLTLVGHDPEGQSIEYRLSFYPDRVGWDVTTGQGMVPGSEPVGYRGRLLSIDALRRCISCHTTNPHATLAGTGAEPSDSAIGCERCHGPGGDHLKVVSLKEAALSHDTDLAIARPSLASGPANVKLCAECHSPTKAGSRLMPGSPDSIRFQGVTLTWSRCYQESQERLDCVTCHNPHRDAETSTAWYESRCLRCHSSVAPTVKRAGSSTIAIESGDRTSCPVQPARGCIKCHMPKLESTVLHTPFTDHFIRVHLAPQANGGP
jgi:tetratricopeptide (TPR) repeat protein